MLDLRQFNGLCAIKYRAWLKTRQNAILPQKGGGHTQGYKEKMENRLLRSPFPVWYTSRRPNGDGADAPRSCEGTLLW